MRHIHVHVTSRSYGCDWLAEVDEGTGLAAYVRCLVSHANIFPAVSYGDPSSSIPFPCLLPKKGEEVEGI